MEVNNSGANIILVFYSRRDGFLYYLRPDGTAVQLDIRGDIFKVYEDFPFQLRYTLPDYDIFPVETEDGIPTYKLVKKQVASVVGAGGGGGTIIRRINNPITILNNGTPITGNVVSIDFEGSPVMATSDANGNVTVTITGGSEPECVIDVTYEQLVALISANALEVGCNYRITNFRTREIIPNTAVVHEGTIEPIIVKASNVNQIHEFAISTIFPQDELSYEVVDSTTAGGDRGRIYRREDMENENEAGYDWRSIIFRRWNDGTGNFTSLTDNGNGFQDYYTWNEQYTGQAFASAPFCFGNRLDSISDLGIMIAGAPTDKLNNFVWKVIAYNNHYHEDCFNNTIGTDGGADISGDNTGRPFFSNNIIGDNFSANNVEVFFSQNIIGNNFSSCVVGFGFMNNDIGDDFTNNHISDNFINNTIANRYSNNIIGDSFSNNIVQDDFSSNTIANNASNNFIGTLFHKNNIGNDFSGNGTALTPIGSFFFQNTIGDNFNSNLVIGSNFQNNHIGDTFASNSIGDVFKSNTIGNFFQTNTIGNSAISNDINDFCHDNVIQNNFLANMICHEFHHNTISTDNFHDNNIGSGFGYNSIRGHFANNVIWNNFGGQFPASGNDINFTTEGLGFENNEIFNNFSSNIVGQVGQTFQFNHIETGLNGVDFTASTHVYGNYTKEIIINSTGTFRLRYTDGADTIIYTAPNA